MDTDRMQSNGAEWLYPSFQKIEGKPSDLIENANSLKDFEFQKVVSLDAGYVILDKMHHLFSEQIGHLPPEQQDSIHQIFKAKKEQFRSLLANQTTKYNTSGESNLSVIEFYKNWKQKKAFEKKMKKSVLQAFEQALNVVGSKGEKQIQAKWGVKSSRSLKKAIVTQMTALRAVSASKSTQNRQTIRAKFELPLLSTDAETMQAFVNEAKRVDTITFLQKQADLQENELKILLARTTSSKKVAQIQSHLAAIQEKKQTYAKMFQDLSWRTSMESNVDVKEKREMSTNPWIERVYFPSPPSVQSLSLAPFQVGRSGAFGFSAHSKTNIQELFQKKAQIPSSEKLEKEIAERESMLRSQLGAMLAAQAETLAEGIQHAITEGIPNLFYDTKTFPYTQISLLHFTGGSEPNLLRDMEWIFKQIEGKKLIFDGKMGFDSGGNLHISKPIFDKMHHPLVVTIESSLYNFNVQGDTFSTNKAQYKTINQRAWQNTQKKYATYIVWLKNLHETGKLSASLYESQIRSLNELKEKIELQLNKKKSNFEIAADISEFERMMNSSLGINCKSGKDRTSYLINKLINRHIGQYIERTYPLYPAELEKLKKYLAAQVIHKGVGLYISGLNMGFKAFKIARFNIEGMRLQERLKLYFIAFMLRST